MNRLKMFAFAIICCLLACNNEVFANENGDDSNVVKIGYLENYGVIQSINESDDKGYGYDYFNELSKYTGHTYEFVECEWEQGLNMLEAGEIDLFGPVQKNEERLEKFGYTKNSFGHEEILLVSPRDSGILFEDFEAINNSKIGIINESAFISTLDEYLAENNIVAEYVMYPELSALKEYDLRLESNLFYEPNLQIVAKLDSIPFYFATNKENEKLLNELDLALSQLKIDDRFFEQDLYIKYYSDKIVAPPALTKEDELLLSKKNNSFTVLISNDHKPFQFVEKNGDVHGIAIDIMDAIALDAGIEFNYVYETENNTINYAEVDLSIVMQNTPFTNKAYDKTDTYMVSPIMLVGKKSVSSDNLGTVGMLDYSNVQIEADEIVRCNTYDELIELIKKGDIDYIASTDLSTTYILEEVGIEDFSAYPTANNIHSKILIDDSLSEYTDIFNKLIARLNYKEIDATVIKHISHFSSEDTIIDILNKNPLFITFMIIIVSIIIIIIIIISNIVKNNALNKIINYDEVTGLISLYRFNILAQEILKTSNINEYLMVSLDIDNFQYLNEAYGYETGNKVLLELANKLVAKYKKNAIITRQNADCFLILTKKPINIHVPCGKEYCDDCISLSVMNILGDNCKTSLCRGVYEIIDPSLKLSYMIDCANSARVLGKHFYRSTSYKFTEEMKLERQISNKIVNSMEAALLNKEFKVYYQPKVNLNDFKLNGAEALVRWIPDNGNIVYPNSFIPLFEKNRFIVELDFYVFEEVCRYIAKWKDSIDMPIISVNLSVITMLNDNLIPKLLSITSKYKLDNSLLELEITESAVAKNFDEAILKVKQLKELGFSTSLDDFGSGLSSLNRLNEMEFDILKIDKDFLSKNINDVKGIAIIENIIDLAEKLNMSCIAEGVETIEHVEYLKKLKCNNAQGYYFSKPINEDEFKSIVINGIDIK